MVTDKFGYEIKEGQTLWLEIKSVGADYVNVISKDNELYITHPTQKDASLKNVNNSQITLIIVMDCMGGCGKQTPVDTFFCDKCDKK